MQGKARGQSIRCLSHRCGTIHRQDPIFCFCFSTNRAADCALLFSFSLSLSLSLATGWISFVLSRSEYWILCGRTHVHQAKKQPRNSQVVTDVLGFLGHHLAVTICGNRRSRHTDSHKRTLSFPYLAVTDAHLTQERPLLIEGLFRSYTRLVRSSPV